VKIPQETLQKLHKKMQVCILRTTRKNNGWWLYACGWNADCRGMETIKYYPLPTGNTSKSFQLTSFSSCFTQTSAAALGTEKVDRKGGKKLE